MTIAALDSRLTDAQQTILALQEELAEADHGLMALTADLENQVDRRTIELRRAHEELEQTNTELLQLTLELENRVAERTSELQATNEILRAQAELLDLAHDAIIVQDLGGTISFWNHGAEEMYGWSREDAIGKSAHTLLRTQFPKLLAEIEAELFQDNRWEGSLLHTRRDGSEVVSASRWSLKRDAQGQPVKVLEINNDITARKLAEEALAHRVAELARSNAELEQFAYVASHDLQEPLRMVASYLELLTSRYQGQLDPRADKYIHYAVDGASRMQAMIQDLLAFSRLTTKAKPIESIKANEVLTQALGNLHKVVQESGVEVSRDALPTVQADPTQLTQVFQNLVANAIKFCEQHPCRVHISVRRESNEWVFSVRDNGIGIAPEHHERIFLLFQRLQTREEYPGTGIGLAICRKVVERHGGRIWVESQPAEGSTFYFTLPTTRSKGP